MYKNGGRNQGTFSTLHPRRPQTVFPYPLQRLRACLFVVIVAPDVGNFCSISIENSMNHKQHPYIFSRGQFAKVWVFYQF